MSDNSIQNLFKSGITREQYLKQHQEVTSKGGDFAENSIFGKTMSGSAGNIFDAVDTNKDGKLDDNELALLSAKGKDDDTIADELEETPEQIEAILNAIYAAGEDADAEAVYRKLHTKESVMMRTG